MDIKALSPFKKEVNQDITARLLIKDFLPNIKSMSGSYSVYKFKGQSKVNEPYSFIVTFVSDFELNISELSDKDAVLTLADAHSSDEKTICGKIYEASEKSVVAYKYMYEIEIVAPLRYLENTNRYRTYQEKTVVEIVQEIIKEFELSLKTILELKLDESKYPKKEYFTQYKQSDLDFISMLCEKEGLVLVYDYSNKEEYIVTLCELSDYLKDIKTSTIGDYNFSKKFESPNSILNYYDENSPSLELENKTGKDLSSSVKDNTFTKQMKTDLKNKEHKTRLELNKDAFFTELQRYTKLEAQRKYVKASTFKANSTQLSITDAINITLNDTSANKQADISIICVNYEGNFVNALDELTQDDSFDKAQYKVKFTAIPADINYVPKLKTKIPSINGVLTAIVSQGNKETRENANEIEVDDKGRIKVLLHFEEGRATTCFLRHAGFFAGNKIGSQFLPRVNSEVVVKFLGGDVSMPMIIGAIYNGDNKHPYPLPQNKSKSYIKTASMPQHEDEFGYNEIAFEDKQHSEELSLRAQKDFELYAQNDSYIDIKNDQIENIINDSTLNVGNDNYIKVKNNQSLEVQNNQTNHIVGTQSEKIDKDKLTKIGGDLNEAITGNYDLKVGRDSTVEVGDTYTLKVGEKIIESAQVIEVTGSNKIILQAPGIKITLDGGGILIEGNVTIKGGLDIAGGAADGSDSFSLKDFTPLSALVKDTDNLLPPKGKALALLKEFKIFQEEDKGTVTNIRLNDIEKIHLTTVINKDIKVVADTTLKEGTSVDVTLYILDKNEEIVAQKTQSSKVKDKEVEEDFDHEKMLEDKNIEIQDDYTFEGEMEWEN